MPIVARGRWILAATILGSSMAFIDGTVVNVALPAIQSAFKATLPQVQWVVEAFALCLAACLLTGGSLGDLYGRRLVFAAGIVLFSAASIWCGASRTIAELIAARGVQGVGAALLVPNSLALISASFPAEQRGRAIGTWSGFTSITAAIGPVLGGWLVQHARGVGPFTSTCRWRRSCSRSWRCASPKRRRSAPRLRSIGRARCSRSPDSAPSSSG